MDIEHGNRAIKLTKTILADIFFSEDKKATSQKPTEATVQIISLGDNKSAIVSDGSLKEKAIFYKNAKALLEQQLNPLSIINVTFILHNSTLIISSASLVHQATEETLKLETQSPKTNTSKMAENSRMVLQIF